MDRNWPSIIFATQPKVVARTEIGWLSGLRLHPGWNTRNPSRNFGESRVRGHSCFRETRTTDQFAALHVGTLWRPHGNCQRIRCKLRCQRLWRFFSLDEKIDSEWIDWKEKSKKERTRIRNELENRGGRETERRVFVCISIRFSGGKEVSEDGRLISDGTDGSYSAKFGRVRVSTDQYPWNTATGATAETSSSYETATKTPARSGQLGLRAAG